tara:strand:- start:567 stop:1343 length:777 start_codon:yes stop_codon:yes gene_type:complete
MKTFLILWLLFITNAMGKNFYCQLNTAPVGKLIEAKDYLRFFTFDSSALKGKKISFKDKTILIWNKKGLIHISLFSGRKKVTVKTSFSPTRQTFQLDVSPHTELLCTSKRKEKVSQGIPVSGKDIFIKIRRPLLFKYYTEDGYEMTRTLIFQKGKISNRHLPLLQNESWCLFRIEFKLNEDTLVPKGIKIPVKRAETFQNNKSFKVYSYSFVDFATGKKGMETSRFVPFSLECKIKTEEVFSKELLNNITNSSFEIMH